MFPLDVVLIGRDDNAMPPIRRELLKNEAAVLVEYPDIRTALEGLEPQDGCRLFVVHVGSHDEVDALRRLSTTFARQPILAVVDEATISNPLQGDPQSSELRKLLSGGCQVTVPAGTLSFDVSHPLFVPAMRAGAMQVVAAPIESHDFQQALECLALHFGQAVKNTLISVAGVLGGCGATTLAVNLGYELAYLTGQHVIACELSLRMGTMASYLDIQPDCTLDSLFDNDHVDMYTLRNGLTHVTDNYEVLCGPYRGVDPHLPGGEEPRIRREMIEAIDGLKRLAPIVLLDVPPTLDEMYFDVLRRSDKVVLVTEQSLAALRSLRNVYEALERTDAAAHKEVVLNRYRPEFTEFSASMLRDKIGLPHISTVADDHLAATGSQNQGRVLRLYAARSPMLNDIDRLAGRLVEIKAPAQAKRRGLFGRLARACGM